MTVSARKPSEASDGLKSLSGWRRRVGPLLDRGGRWPLIALVYIGVKFFRGMDSVVRVHDHLDHIQAVYSRMSLGDLFSAPGSTLDFTLGGLPRAFVGSEFSIGTIIAVALPLIPGLILAELLYRSIAYYGMRRLLGVTGLSAERIVYLGVPTLFAIMPFYHPAFASIAGVPLLISALVQIHRQPSRRDWLIVAVFPVLGMAQATIPYAVMLIGYSAIAAWLRLAPVRVLRAAGVYVAALLVVEWRLPLAVFMAPTSNRLDFETGGDTPLSTGVFSVGRVILETGEKHVAHSWPYLIPLVIVAGVAGIATVLVRGRSPSSPDRTLMAAAAGMAVVGIVGAAWPILDGRVIRPLIGDYPLVQIDRVVWLVPGLAYLALAAAAAVLLIRFPGRVVSLVVVAILGAQGVALWRTADFNRPPLAQLTINEFFAPDLLGEVRQVVEADGGGTVVSVGFDPSVALYNGFDTADGAWSSYPLDYKKAWARLIAPAIAEDPGIARYFQGYGNRVYVFQPVFGIVFCCEIPVVDEYSLLIDDSQFDSLGIDYVLSNGLVTNSAELGLRFVATVVQPGSDYRISIYRA
jgi:hypothetical protein